MANNDVMATPVALIARINSSARSGSKRIREGSPNRSMENSTASYPSSRGSTQKHAIPATQKIIEDSDPHHTPPSQEGLIADIGTQGKTDTGPTSCEVNPLWDGWEK